MQTDDNNPFSRALLEIDPRLLRDAFDHCNRRSDLIPYDRTTLGRWLAGSVPTRGEFVASLADRLGDLAVYEAWLEARDAPGTAVKTLVTRFRGLSSEEKQQAFHRIRDDLARDVAGPVRSRYTMRVELHDGSGGLFQLRMASNWTGYLPANATIIIATSDEQLHAAYDQRECLFRDVVEIDWSAVEMGLSEWDDQVLSFSSTDGDSGSSRCQGQHLGDGVFRFDNPEIQQARIMLRVSYPYPTGVQIYPIVFRNYQISGPAEITLALRTPRAHNPRGYAFLGTGRRWQSSTWADEVVIEAGSSRTLLGADTGIMLHWAEGEAIEDRLLAPVRHDRSGISTPDRAI
jgi:hypothetical protein